MGAGAENTTADSGRTETAQSAVLNPVNWWKIEVPDLDQASAFYGTVFDWTMVPFDDSSVFAKRARPWCAA
jgi:hypothetical protein